MTSNYFQLLILCAISTLARAYIVVAPSQLVAGNEETILLINDQNQVLKGEVTLEDNPNLSDDDQYSPQTVELPARQMAVLKFQINQHFTPHIDLKTTLNGVKKSKTLRVSQKSGHIFLQTDKPLYNPKETTVHIRFMATDENLMPANRTYRLQVKNPDGQLAMSQDFYESNQSLFSFNYTLPEDPMLGEWLVMVLYGDGFKQSERLTFVMEEYVLPTFRVDVDMPETLIPSMKSVTVRVKATHVYGKPVRGQVMIKEFLKTAAGDPQQHQSAGNWTLLDEEGEAEFQVDLTPYQIGDAWQPSVLQRRLLIEAVVLEKSTSKQESGFSDKALFERNLYKISTQMQPEIRPGYPALATIQVRHPNGRIASDVAVELKVLDDDEKQIKNLPQKVVRTDENGLASFLIPTDPKYSQIRVSLEVGNAPQTSTHTATLKAYKGREYVALKKIPVTKKFAVGGEVETELNFHPKGVFTGAVTAAVTGGKIMATKNIRPSSSSTKESFSFKITEEMSPMTRIVAIAWKNNGDIFIDSFFISIENNCRNADYELVQSVIPKPGGSGDIEVSGAKRGTVIGIMAVDEAVYALRSGNILTRESIFSRLEATDRGCKDGGGVDVESSAGHAGIVVFTDKIDVPDGDNCHTKRHLQRARRDAIADRFKGDPLGEKCCRLAFSNYFLGKSCEDRSQALINEFRKDNRLKMHCQKVFLDCCAKDPVGYVVMEKFLTTDQSGLVGQSRGRFGPDAVIEESIPETKVREDFRESFLFQEIIMDDSERKNIKVTLPHSITTWSIQSVSVNPQGGVCAQAPIQVAVEQNFFLQVDLPYKVVRNEHILIKVSLYNYNNKQVYGNLYIYGVNDVCTQARPGSKSEAIRFDIAANSAFKVDIPVFPLKEGYYPLKIEAISSEGSDLVVKELYVVPEGREVRQSYSVPIDPTNTQRRRARSVCGPSCKSQIDPVKKNQTITIDTLLPEDVVEGTSQVTLSVIGEKMGPAVYASINDIDSLVSLPKGCGEQNMMRLAPLVFVAEYKKQTGKLDPKQEAKIKQNMMQAYSRQMAFQKRDGSFCAFRNRGSSIWLTAFVAKVFCRASQFFADPQTFPLAASRAVEWLTSKQQPDGSFTEIKPILHKALLGGVRGKLALTSFVTAALDECALHLSSEQVRLKYRKSISAAKNALMRNYDTATNGYTAALAAYALSNTNYSSMALDRMRSLMIKDTDSNTISLKKEAYHPWVIEGTAYALLAATKAKRSSLAPPIFYWLSAQQTLQGGFQTTQDTVVALQALSEFLSSNPQPPVDLSLHVKDGQGSGRVLRVIRESASIPQTLSTEVASNTLEVHATGYGSGVLSVLIKYNTLIPPEEKCPFNVTISAIETDTEDTEDLEVYSYDRSEAEKTVENLLQRNRRQRRSLRADQLAYNLKVCVFLLSDTASAMSIVKVEMVTGYEAVKDDLVKLVRGRQIEKFDMLPDHVTLYVSEFEPHRNTCFSFRVAQQFTVANAQPAPVSVYDYYNKIGNCPIFYSLSHARRVLVECDGDSDKMCKCLQNSCPPLVPFETRSKTDLASTRKGREVAQRLICAHDYVVEGKVIEMRREQRTLFFKMNVTYAWREKYPMLGTTVTFMQKEYCKNLMATDLSYMVFGDETIPHRNENGTVHKTYSLNERSKVFYPNSMVDTHIKGNFDLLKVRKITCS